MGVARDDGFPGAAAAVDDVDGVRLPAAAELVVVVEPGLGSRDRPPVAPADETEAARAAVGVVSVLVCVTDVW